MSGKPASEGIRIGYYPILIYILSRIGYYTILRIARESTSVSAEPKLISSRGRFERLIFILAGLLSALINFGHDT